MDNHFDKECLKATMSWYGWGSPIGLTIFFIGLCICALIIRKAFFC